MFHFRRKIFGEKVSLFEKIGLSLGGLDNVKVKFSRLRFSHNLGQESFADGAKHADLQEGVFGLKSGVELLRLLDGHRSVHDKRAFLLGRLHKRFVARLQLSCKARKNSQHP
jgi:hypothetical protein